MSLTRSCKPSGGPAGVLGVPRRGHGGAEHRAAELGLLGVAFDGGLGASSAAGNPLSGRLLGCLGCFRPNSGSLKRDGGRFGRPFFFASDPIRGWFKEKPEANLGCVGLFLLWTNKIRKEKPLADSAWGCPLPMAPWPWINVAAPVGCVLCAGSLCRLVQETRRKATICWIHIPVLAQSQLNMLEPSLQHQLCTN